MQRDYEVSLQNSFLGTLLYTFDNKKVCGIENFMHGRFVIHENENTSDLVRKTDLTRNDPWHMRFGPVDHNFIDGMDRYHEVSGLDKCHPI